MDRRYFENIDWILIITVLSISLLGIITIYSVTHDDAGLPDYIKQIFWVIIGVALFIAIQFFDYNRLNKFAYPLFVLTTLTLVYLLIFGRTELGVQRWIEIPVIGFKFQPSEFAKLTLVIILSRFFSSLRGNKPRFKDLVLPTLITCIPLALVLLQPDLGTSLLLIPVLVALIFVSGISVKMMVILALAFIIPAGIAGPKIIKPYQLKRITSFLDPEADPLGSGYHLIQSKIAFGSGGVWGKGFQKGSQSSLDFLPVQDTDFIFSVWGEERGFAGALILLSLFILVILRSLRIARRSRDLFGTYLTVGITVILFCQILINTGMVIGLMPITGLPLPFMSYGGSACLTNFLSLAIIANVGIRRFVAYRSE